MNLPFRSLAFSCALLLGSVPALTGQPASGMAAAHTAKFIDLSSLNYEQILVPPPATDSLAGQADRETLVRTQALRSPEQAKWAGTILKADLFSSAGIIGPNFTKENFPLTEALVKAAVADGAAATDGAKDIFKRVRPYTTYPEIKPCVNLPGGYSYPSGYAMTVYTRAAVLSEIFPDKRDALFAQARERAWARVIGGVHYPTDIIGGKLLAEAVAAALLKSPSFQAALTAAKAEASK